MNKYIRFIMAIIMAVVLLSIGLPSSLFGETQNVYAESTVDKSWYDQDKQEMEINSVAQLMGLAEIVNEGIDQFSGKTIRLSNDIDFSNITSWNPIGIYKGNSDDKAFQGTFDGNNYSIKNMLVEDETDYITDPFTTLVNNFAIFSYIKNAEIKNLNVCGDYILKNPTNTSQLRVTYTGYSGGVAGFSDNSVITNCNFDGNIVGGYCVGGILGRGVNTTIDSCDVVGCKKIDGGVLVGGIAGYLYGTSSSVKNCSFAGTISAANNYAGGIIGSTDSKTASIPQASKSYIYNCKTLKGSTITAKKNAGGIVSTAQSEIKKCMNFADIKVTAGTNNVAGIVSSMVETVGDGIVDCGNYGNLEGGRGVKIAGIAIGNSLNICNVINTGNVTSTAGTENTTGIFFSTNIGLQTSIENGVNLGKVTAFGGSPYIISNVEGSNLFFDAALGESEIGVAKTMEEFKNRTVVDFLNGDAEEPVWFQNVDYPDFAGNMTPVEEITVDKTAEVGIDKEVDIKAVLTPDDATNKGLIFTSSDEEIATVTADGKVSGKKVGEADITVMALYDGSKAVCKVTVKDLDKEAAQKVIDEIKAIDPSKATLEELEAIQKKYDALTPEQKAIVDADADASAAKKTIDAKVEELEKAKKDDQQTTVAVKNDTKFTVKGYKYTVTSNLKKNPTVKINGYKNKKLKKIAVPASVTYKKVAFKVTEISKGAFKNQKKAASTVIGKNVDTIGASAFAGDAKLKKITVKSAVVKKVGAKALKGINKKAVIKVPAKSLKAYKKLFKGKGQKKTVKIKK